MSFKSVLSSIGHELQRIFQVAEKVAVASEPVVAIFFPAEAGLFNFVVNAVGTTEAAAVAAGQQTGTGSQKLALVVASVEDSFKNYAAQKGYVNPTADEIQKAVNAAVTFLNALNATPSAPKAQ